MIFHKLKIADYLINGLDWHIPMQSEVNLIKVCVKFACI